MLSVRLLKYRNNVRESRECTSGEIIVQKRQTITFFFRRVVLTVSGASVPRRLLFSSAAATNKYVAEAVVVGVVLEEPLQERPRAKWPRLGWRVDCPVD